LTFVLCLYVFLPALDLEVFEFLLGEGFDEGLGKTCVGHQRDVVVDGCTTYLVAVGQFALGLILRHIDDEFEAVLGNEVEYVLAFLIGPCNGCGGHSVLVR